MDAVESLLKIPLVDLQLPLPFSALFDDVTQSEDVVRSSSFFSKTWLCLSESLVYCFRELPDDELGQGLAGDFGIFPMTPFSLQVVVTPPTLLQRAPEELVLQTLALP